MPSSTLASGTREMALAGAAGSRFRSALRVTLGALGRDKAALVSAIFLALVFLCALVAPALLSPEARSMNLMQRNAAPFDLSRPFVYILGADALGRSLLARVLVASQNTLLIAGSAVLASMVIGTLLGLVAGYREGPLGATLLRLADAIMSFPSMLLAVIVLFIFEPGVTNVILVLAISRIPIFLRTARAEVLEVRQRLFVTSALAMGASTSRILLRHILPMVVPTIVNLAALEMAFVMLVESGLSFLGIGIQPPAITWGLMVADGRNYIGSAWWVAFWPGLAIMLVTMSLNLFSNWLRVVSDPVERWRLLSKEE